MSISQSYKSRAFYSQNHELRGALYIALSGTLFGLMAYLGTKLIVYNFSISNMLFWRFLFASVFIILITLFVEGRKKFFSSFKEIKSTFLLSTLSYSGGSIFYFMGSKTIGTGLAMVLFFSFPVFVTLFSFFFDQWKLTKHSILALISVMVGLFFLKGDGESALDLGGILFAIIAAFSYAVYIYSSRHLSRKTSPYYLTCAVCVGNTLLFALLSFYTHSFAVPADLHTWSLIFIIGLFSTALPIQFLLLGLKYISPVKASVLSVLEPVVTLIIGTLFLNEVITMVQMVGISILLLGALVIQFERAPIEDIEVTACP